MTISISTRSPRRAARRSADHQPGLRDGPDYSPDGKWIYFNSDRSGSWDIWRMPAAGAGAGDEKAERITSDDFEDWFPHPSPDGKWIVFISFAKGTKGHPANQNVVLRRMPMGGGKDRGDPQAVWRTGDDERELLVARQQEVRVRELRNEVGGGSGSGRRNSFRLPLSGILRKPSLAGGPD